LNRKAYKYIFFCLVSLVSTSGFSQTTFTEEEDAYEPDSLMAVRNAIKFDPVQIIFGDYELYYERIITKGFSFEVGMGVTGRNYAVGWSHYSLDNLARNVNIKTGGAFTFTIRKYIVSSEELNGPYVGLGIKALNYKTEFEVVDSAGVLTNNVFTDSRRYLNLQTMIGWQWLPATSNVFVDGFIGVAFRNMDFDVVRSQNINDPNAYSVTNEKDTDFAFIVGLRIGYGF
jgi:hypothetical protein